MKLIDLFPIAAQDLTEKKHQGFFAAVDAAKHGGKRPKNISQKTWGEARKVAGKGGKKKVK